MNKLRYLILWLVLLLILGMTNWSIFEKEDLLANGQVILLELAPVDPRSLIWSFNLMPTMSRHFNAAMIQLNLWPSVSGFLNIVGGAMNSLPLVEVFRSAQKVSFFRKAMLNIMKVLNMANSV